jgi:hypothetical protein
MISETNLAIRRCRDGHPPIPMRVPPPTAIGVQAVSRRLPSTSAWDKLLKSYVATAPDTLNRVDYGRFKSGGHAALKAYVAALQKVDPATLDKPEQFAFWVNQYNAKTIDVVLDKYPVKSIKDVSLGGGLKALVGGGPWQAKIMKVSGIELSLDDIENTILRAHYGDPRVHYAVNCASVGCPNLAVEAYRGGKARLLELSGSQGLRQRPARLLVGWPGSRRRRSTTGSRPISAAARPR